MLKMAVTCALGLITFVPAYGQVLPQSVPTPAEAARSAAEPAKPDDLLAGFAERFGSAIQFTFGLSDVSDFRVRELGFEPSPDDALWKGTVTFKLQSLFTSTSDLKAAYEGLEAYQGVTGAARRENPLPEMQPASLVEYFARTRSRDRVGRFLSAFTVSASQGERSELDFGPDGRPEGLTDSTKWTWDATFDPAKLFTSPSQKAEAFAAILSYLKLFPDVAHSMKPFKQCPTDRPCWTKQDLYDLGGLKLGRAVLASLIPTIKLESIDQFDYATIGGQPVLFPDSQDGALQNITFTWDLLKVVRPTSTKTAALAALKELKKLQAAHDVLQTPLAFNDPGTIKAIAGQYVAHVLAATSTDDSLSWSRTKKLPWGIDGLHITAEGVLVGKPQCTSGVLAPCSGQVFVTVEDSVGRNADAIVTVNLQ